MNNTIKDTLFAVIILALVVIGYIVYQQGQIISRLEVGESNNTPSTATTFSPPVQSNESYVQTYTAQQTSIVGQIKAIAGSVVTVEASVADASMLTQIDMSKPFTIPQIVKTYQIQITPATIFINKTLSELKIGDSVEVTASTPILTVSTFAANKVIYLSLVGIPTPSQPASH